MLPVGRISLCAVELARHRRGRSQRAYVRTLVRPGNAAGQLQKHHSCQQAPMSESGAWQRAEGEDVFARAHSSAAGRPARPHLSAGGQSVAKPAAALVVNLLTAYAANAAVQGC